MKLISFAVVSLLAITVSAQPPLSTSADKDVIKQKLQDLWAVYRAQIEVVLKLEEPGKAEQEEQAIRSVMKDIEEQLQRKDLSEGEIWDLQKHYAGSMDDLKKAQSAQIPKQQQLEEARNQRYDYVVKINILNENLKRKKKQDAKDKSKTGTSSSLSPHRDILQEQMNEAFQDADDLYISDQSIKEGVDKLDDVIKRTKNPKISKLYETWDKFTATRVKYIKQVGSAIDQRSRTKELQAEFGWTSQNSRVWDLYQSFLLMI
ncbi:hypothetical protein BASA50_011000 [Batrachochytrium salamandrivorans]|uniref:Uncharacterized protein n=1 Tax=Batrachochytrium salamandrivorans TaxID=1357716 RepID=A0ABQ8EX01_9FUNG|nr:hypothetical protein BASA60_002728 [Batrachochytrium salamandrivorans]KAH6587980.1 hypothetical protein BASA50_011000 [Batrachochytrium salamandrivorans]